jgi:tripartite-type tricarboxylate transporter receptor subunit TctC
MIRNCWSRAGVLALSIACAAPFGASAQEKFPSRVMKIVVPNAPGGSTDTAARILANEMRDILGQTAIVENRAGGLGQIAFDYVARSAPDGYTMFLTTGSVALQQVVNKNFPYEDIVKALTPVAIFAEAPLVFAVSSQLPVKTLGEFIAYAKANPGKVLYGSQGALDTFSNDLFKIMTGIDAVTVRYNGVNPAMLAVLKNEVQYTLPTISFVKAQENSDKIRALAVTTGKRSALIPELPAMAEAGVPGYDIGVWFMVLVPTATPTPIVEQLHDAILEASRRSATRLQALGVTLVSYSAEQSKQILVDDIAKWKKVAAETGYKPE